MHDSHTRRRSLPIILLALSLVSVGLLAVQAFVAERERDRAARAAIEGFEQVVAAQSAAHALSIINAAVQGPFTALEQADPSRRGIDVLLEHTGEAERCDRLVDRWAVRTRIPGGDDDAEAILAGAEWSSTDLTPAVRLEIVDQLVSRYRERGADWGVFGVTTLETPVSPVATLVVGASKWRPGPEGSSLYALSSCLELGAGSLFDEVVDHRMILPASLTGATAMRRLFDVTVDAEGLLGVWTSGSVPVAEGAETTFDAPFEGLRVAAGATDEGRARLIPGGGRGRLWAWSSLGLFLLNAGLLVAALVQFRREADWIRARGGFVTAVSHELRTPLQQILLFSDLLHLDRFESDAERHRATGIVAREVKRLIHLVENVLAFRPDGARPSAPVRTDAPYSFDSLVRDTVGEFRPLASARGVDIELLTACPGSVDWHPDAVRRVLLNLLDNAVKYGPAHGRVRVETRCDGRAIVLQVSDEGPGIPARLRPRVTEPYFRGSGDAVDNQGGSGIGLSIVSDLVAAIEGTLTFGDGPSGGLLVTVAVPDLASKPPESP